MPLPIAHGLLGASVIAWLHPQPAATRNYRPLLIGALLANAADLDFLLVFALQSKAWHRGFSHSIAFALLVCVIFTVALGKPQLRLAIAYGLAFASHGFLDYVTSKEGSGVALLWPFSGERLIFGWWGLSEVPSKLTPLEILGALTLEFMLFTPLLLGVLLLRKALARRSGSPASAI